MAKTTKVQKLRAELADKKRQLEEAEQAEAARIGRLAVDAGLLDVSVPDAKLKAAFADLAASFREGDGQTVQAGEAPASA